MSLPIYEIAKGGKAADPQLVALADQAAAKYAIPANIFKSMIYQESTWDVSATPGIAGNTARGLGQVTVGAQKDVERRYGISVDMSTPSGQLESAAAYLRMQYDKFGNWDKALQAYNQGAGNVGNNAGQVYAETVLKRSGENLRDSSQAIVQDTSGAAVGETESQGVGAWFDRQKNNLALLILGLIIIVIAVMRSDAGKQIIVEAAKGAGE